MGVSRLRPLLAGSCQPGRPGQADGFLIQPSAPEPEGREIVRKVWISGAISDVRTVEFLGQILDLGFELSFDLAGRRCMIS